MKRLILVVLAVAMLWVAKSVGDLDQLLLGQQHQANEGTYQPARAAQLDELLDQVDVVRDRPDVPGYDRECGPGHACGFGPDWSDDTTAPLSRNGCDTRNDLLSRGLGQVRYRSGTNECVVVAGRLRDPYTGQLIEFRKTTAHDVGVDHLIPLARAWDLGAAGWPQARRDRFANDPINLVVVSGSANSSKSDRGPGEWLPINARYRCTYGARYLQVAVAYDLPITRPDRRALRLLATRCGERK